MHLSLLVLVCIQPRKKKESLMEGKSHVVLFDGELWLAAMMLHLVTASIPVLDTGVLASREQRGATRLDPARGNPWLAASQ